MMTLTIGRQLLCAIERPRLIPRQRIPSLVTKDLPGSRITTVVRVHQVISPGLGQLTISLACAKRF
jgi:hypothetical protein